MIAEEIIPCTLALVDCRLAISAAAGRRGEFDIFLRQLASVSSASARLTNMAATVTETVGHTLVAFASLFGSRQCPIALCGYFIMSFSVKSISTHKISSFFCPLTEVLQQMRCSGFTCPVCQCV
jgi:hypothetical protein